MDKENKRLLDVARSKFFDASKLTDEAILIMNEVNKNIGAKDIYLREGELYFFTQVIQVLRDLEGTPTNVKDN